MRRAFLLSVIAALGCSSAAKRKPVDAGADAVVLADARTGFARCQDPVTGRGSRYDGRCVKSENCKWDEACVNQVCRKQCSRADDCRRMRGCVAGACAACSDNSHCDAGETCHRGYCIKTPFDTWELQVDAQQWFDMLHSQLYDKQEIPCALQQGPTLYPGCTVRPRGQSSLDYPKPPLRVTFAEDAANPGYSRHINLRSEYNDRSILRLVLANETFRYLTELPVPRTRFVRLRVNAGGQVEDYGLYVDYETIGGKFLENHRRNRDASMFEADPESADLFREGISALVTLPQAGLYPKGYQKKTGVDDSYAELVDLIEQQIAADVAEGSACRTRQAIDMELYLDYLAVMALIQNKDHPRKNYYLTWQQSAQGRRWEFYPWDLDLSFGCTYDDTNLTLCDDAQSFDEALTWGMIPEGMAVRYPLHYTANAVIDRVLRDPGLRAEYERRICEITQHPFWTTQILELIDAYVEVLLPEVRSDRLDRNGQVGQDDPAGSEASFRADVERLRQFLRDRTTFLRSTLGCT